MAIGLHNMVLCLQAMGRLAEALEHEETALGIAQRCLGDEHPHTRLMADKVRAIREALAAAEEEEGDDDDDDDDE